MMSSWPATRKKLDIFLQKSWFLYKDKYFRQESCDAMLVSLFIIK